MNFIYFIKKNKENIKRDIIIIQNATITIVKKIIKEKENKKFI